MVDFYHVIVVGVYCMYHLMLWPEFIAIRTAGLNFCARFALLIDEFDKLSWKISENRNKLSF